MLHARLARQPIRHAACAALLAFFVCALAGCESFPPTHSDSLLTRDVLEIKDTLNKSIEQQTAANRRLDSEVGQLVDASQGKKDALQTSIDDLSKRIQEQSEELVKLRQEVQALSAFSHPGAPAGGLAAPPAPPPGQQPGFNSAQPPAPGPNTAMQAYQQAFKAYQAGDFQAARDGFQTALGANPGPELKIDGQYWLAEAELKLDDKEGASKDFRSLILEHNDHPKAWISLERMADIELDQGKKESALKKLQQIADRNPHYANITRVRQKIAEIKGGGGAAAEPAGGDQDQQPAESPNIDIQQ